MNNTPEWLNWTDKKKYDKTSYCFEYIYGIKDIQIKLNEYEQSSAYVTKPIQIEGNIMGASIEVDESNILVLDANENTNQYDTSIEHYVAFVEYPSLLDWHPILPQG